MKATRFIALAGLLVSIEAMAEVAVIVHPSNKSAISERQVIDLYMLKERYFADGSKAQIYNLSGDAAAKDQFYKGVLHKDESRLNAHWVRVLFSSKGSAPVDVDNAAKMKAAVAGNPGAIGFINAEDVDDSVRVVLRK